MKYISLKSR